MEQVEKAAKAASCEAKLLRFCRSFVHLFQSGAPFDPFEYAEKYKKHLCEFNDLNQELDSWGKGLAKFYSKCLISDHGVDPRELLDELRIFNLLIEPALDEEGLALHFGDPYVYAKTKLHGIFSWHLY